MKSYGYVRVSTRDQNQDRQLFAMREVELPDRAIFADRQSGKDFDRPAYQKLMKRLSPGDLLYIHSIDRLGRNYDEILNQWRIITKEKRVNIVVLDMPLLDTREKEKDLTCMFIADLVLQILSYVAETERANIRKRQAEGIAAAKLRGKHMGRPIKQVPDKFEEVYRHWKEKKISARKAAQLLEVSHGTFLKWSQNQ